MKNKTIMVNIEYNQKILECMVKKNISDSMGKSKLLARIILSKQNINIIEVFKQVFIK